MDMSQEEAEETMHRLARKESIFCDVSSGAAVAAAVKVEREVSGAAIVAVICDRIGA